jgi:hypothetical protein
MPLLAGLNCAGPFARREKQIPRGLKSARDDKVNGECGTDEAVPFHGRQIQQQVPRLRGLIRKRIRRSAQDDRGEDSGSARLSRAVTRPVLAWASPVRVSCRTTNLGTLPRSVTAAWRTQIWRRGGGECRGRRLSTGRRNPDMRCARRRNRRSRHGRAPGRDAPGTPAGRRS